ncbi:A/G-specific adenine glycosylase [Bacillaceae bacterium SIJ1]|nr:A/G-specific adenine glycosylase [Litoribacterium kuwaitense]NGP46572.1 A/G-specific adenine glycosylase [Litoribacterium kuwaitense]
MQKTEKTNTSLFQKQLIDWFQKEQRDLPWRQNKDPYSIWLSEVMLQQTRVDTVIPYFLRFKQSYPTLTALAEAHEEEVLKHWEGLGYYSRVRNFQAAVREVEAHYGGEVPDDKQQFQSLKGVGPYTAGAVMSIAFNQPVPAVDGNVLRVFSRIFDIHDDIAEEQTKKGVERLVAHIIDKNNPADFNQAVMELGAIVCTPKNPACLLCPVQDHCQAYKNGSETELPVKKKKKKAKVQHMTALVIESAEGEILIHKRPASGLLANLWEFPNGQTVHRAQVQREQITWFMEDEYGLSVRVGEKPLQQVRHVFTHLIWEIDVFKAELLNEDDARAKPQFAFASREAVLQYPFSVSHQKILHQVLKEDDE